MNVIKNPMCFRSGCVIFLLSDVLDIKTQRYTHEHRESRWEYFHLSLWCCLSSRSCDSRPLAPLSLSPLDSFYSRSLATSLCHSQRKLQLWPRALAATFLLSRRFLPPCFLCWRPSSSHLLSSHRPTFFTRLRHVSPSSRAYLPSREVSSVRV